MPTEHKSITFKIPVELWERMRVAAFKDRVSMSEYARRSIIEKIERDAEADGEIFNS